MATTADLSLPPHAYVALDNLLSDDLIDDGTYVALALLDPEFANASGMFDGLDTFEKRSRDPRTGSLSGKRAWSAMLNATSTSIAARLGASEQCAIASMRRSWLSQHATSLAWFFAHSSFEDETTGGALDPWLPSPRLHRDGQPFRKVMGRLHNATWMRTKVSLLEESRVFTATAKRVLGNCNSRGTADANIVQVWRQRMAENRHAASRMSTDLFLREQGINPRNLKPTATAKRMSNSRRRVLKRSLRTAMRFIPASEISRFANGDAVRLIGTSVDLIVERSGSLTGLGAHQLEVTVASPAGPRLADLCVYIDKTPALDQLTGLALAMAAGEDEQIIRDANVIRIYPAGETHPLIAGRGRLITQTRHHNRSKFDLIQTAYVERTTSRWMDELLRFADVDRRQLAA